MTTNYAQLERKALAELMLELGPDAPTLCEGWTTRDMAAHLVVRETRPDAAIGLVASPLAGHGENIRRKYASKRYEQLVDAVRSGPPLLSPTKIGAVDRLVNTVEFFVHHEDVRRAQPDWKPRSLPTEETEQLLAALKRMAKLFLRKAPSGVTLHPDGEAAFVAKQSQPEQMVTIAGPVGEILLFVEGRQAHTQVELSGNETLKLALQKASFGI